jgi:methyl-accepting chemotaxis protein
MFWGNNAKDIEIAKLKQKITELESAQNNDNILINEMNEVLSKTKRGVLNLQIKEHSSNPKLNELKQNLNDTLQFNSAMIDKIVEILIAFGNSKFDYKVDINNSSGSLGSIILGIQSLGFSVSELLGLIDISANKLNTEMNELSKAAYTLSNASNEQAASLEETAAALEEITGTIVNNTDKTIQMSSYAQKVIASAKSGQEMSNQTDKAMDEIKEQVQSINEAITVIDQIAFQTNILSLNAAVEAATAGEAGKGFAVVAGEVRNLANRSAEAAKDIKAIVENATEKTNSGKVVADKMTKGYEELYDNINNTMKLISDVSHASKEQQDAIQQINSAVNTLDMNTQQNAAAANQIKIQAEDIKVLSSKLVDVVEHTSYHKSSQKEVCNVDMMFKLNSLKLDHINFKDTNFNKLDSKASWKVSDETQCNLGKWIKQMEDEKKPFTKSANWSTLKHNHLLVHSGVQNTIDANASDNLDGFISEVEKLDENVSAVFSGLQNVKGENCSQMTQISPITYETSAKQDSKPTSNDTTNTSTQALKKLNPIQSSKDDDEWESF